MKNEIKKLREIVTNYRTDATNYRERVNGALRTLNTDTAKAQIAVCIKRQCHKLCIRGRPIDHITTIGTYGKKSVTTLYGIRSFIIPTL